MSSLNSGFSFPLELLSPHASPTGLPCSSRQQSTSAEAHSDVSVAECGGHSQFHLYWTSPQFLTLMHTLSLKTVLPCFPPDILSLFPYQLYILSLLNGPPGIPRGSYFDLFSLCTLLHWSPLCLQL